MFETWRDFDGIFRRFISGIQEKPTYLTTRQLLPKLADAQVRRRPRAASGF